MGGDPDDVVQLRTSAKSCNKGSKYGSYGELLFFLLQIDQHKYPEGNIDTPLGRYKFTPIKKQNSLINRLRKHGLTPRGDSNASGSGSIPSFGTMMVECVDDHNREMSDRRMWAASGHNDDDNSLVTSGSLSSNSDEE